MGAVVQVHVHPDHPVVVLCPCGIMVISEVHRAPVVAIPFQVEADQVMQTAIREGTPGRLLTIVGVTAVRQNAH
jgi:hypothetical protein